MKLTPIEAALIFAGVVLAYALCVFEGGLGNSFLAWKYSFDQTGKFGTSFGGLTAITSAIAAYFAFLAYQRARDESASSRARADAVEAGERRRDIERLFFHLLTLRRSVLLDIKSHVGARDVTGADAAKQIASDLASVAASKPAAEAYKQIYTSNQNALGHYFRLTYHIVRSIERSDVPDDTKMDLMRLLRAQWSTSEQILVLANCAYGEGREKFRPLASKYALGHNVDMKGFERLYLEEVLPAQTFSGS